MAIKLELDTALRDLGTISPEGYYIGVHIRVAAPLMTFNTYPQPWIDHYTQQAFALRDPTTAWGFSCIGATRWSAMDIPDPFGILTQAADFGLKYGVTISAGEITSRTIGSVARSESEFTDDEIARIEAIVNRLHVITEPPEDLTKAQTQALQLIAAGDRHAAAAAKLGISESALKARLTSARRRLMARTTAEAIQRAKDYRLL
ncbi:helix-turn-helix transcriptional regulator [Actibacterium lipolyticum]|uniref:Autoinducer binding domain protein n=1 Tax=Actibacterium lipolyticum TaxID=1524263 RepID=A0A238JL93_9RHOB|nr:autoinducer binding domain-containing protein [Actibacterium lipolyticum]SMX30974.1 Autoinducer binding domain protein [Actibacterium lipolyticum]